MRHRLLLSACLLLSLSASAAAHTSVGGGGSADDPNADCLRWEVVTPDGAVPDAAADAGRTDAGSSGITVLRCAEHATMFGCSCALGPQRRGREAATVLATAALAALVAGARRARRPNRRPGGGR